MKGIVLAGGMGTRLLPLTLTSNKHLLPVGDEPMIFHPIRLLVSAGITEIQIVTGGNSPGDFLQLFADCADRFGSDVQVSFVYQQGSGGIPAAMRCARTFAGDASVCVVLGDNIFEVTPQITQHIQTFTSGCRLLLASVPDLTRFGVVDVDLPSREVRDIIEKPKSHMITPYMRAITGLYCFDSRVWEKVDTLRPSSRGELEVVDLHRSYHADAQLSFSLHHGWWTDAGTHDSLFRANLLIRGYHDTIPRSTTP
tara:strand:- start:5984 stop:6745 length:762 start_codon:yes stop_codon:yes gene_type:complete